MNQLFFLNNEKEFKDELLLIFNNRCCYCGASFEVVLNFDNVEIDHIYSKSAKSATYFNKNSLLNLAPACHNCNNLKRSIIDTKEDAEEINPYKSISNAFYRSEDLYIKIKDDKKAKEIICSFYNQLGLYKEIHRLSYILLILSEMKKKYKESSEIYNKVSKIFDIIHNSFNYSLK